jgi:hypothetical protein
MGPGRINEYLAASRRHDLLSEARRAALAAETSAATDGTWSIILVEAADLLLYAGHRLRAYAAHKRLARLSYGAPRGSVASLCHGQCQRDDSHVLPQRVLWLDV